MSTDRDRYDQQYVATHAAVQVAPVRLDDKRPRSEARLHNREDFWYRLTRNVDSAPRGAGAIQHAHAVSSPGFPSGRGTHHGVPGAGQPEQAALLFGVLGFFAGTIGR